jgi:hypothetical protein
MGISEFAVHNVLRTYTRQERVGRLQKPRADSAAPGKSPDQVTLSSTARKTQWVGQLAAEVVDARSPGLGAEERSVQVRDTKDALLRRHNDDLRDEALAPEGFEARLRSLYLR